MSPLSGIKSPSNQKAIAAQNTPESQLGQTFAFSRDNDGSSTFTDNNERSMQYDGGSKLLANYRSKGGTLVMPVARDENVGGFNVYNRQSMDHKSMMTKR